MKPNPTAPRKLQRIVLTGFMGSGKTTVGRLLAAKLAWQFADLDDHVEAREGRTVPQIFAEKGEPAFRAAETSALAELLAGSELVVALGGGAPGTSAVRVLLAAATGTIVVHLHAPFSVLYDRCQAQARDPGATERPLLGDRPSAQQRYEARRAFYDRVAHLTIEADAGTPEAIAETILRTVTDPSDSHG